VWSSNGPIPHIVECTANRRFSCVATLDPRQAYLSHHCPGGDPLLGTVMGIETMGRAARLYVPTARIIRVSDVVIGPAYVVKGGGSWGRSLTIDAETGQEGPEETSVVCKVTSRRDGRDLDCHFAARFCLSKGLSEISDRICLPSQPSGPVKARDIYSLFFHGPWFRVIREAAKVNGDMVAYSALNRAEILDVDRYETAPRAIEFGLQTAGLLELAETGRMMIPKAIQEIEILNAGDEPSGGHVIAIARRSRCREERELLTNSVDIAVTDGQGRVLIRIRGYETAPIPFSVDNSGLGHVRELLRHSA
jgi:hypothetical protein